MTVRLCCRYFSLLLKYIYFFANKVLKISTEVSCKNRSQPFLRIPIMTSRHKRITESPLSDLQVRFGKSVNSDGVVNDAPSSLSYTKESKIMISNNNLKSSWSGLHRHICHSMRTLISSWRWGRFYSSRALLLISVFYLVSVSFTQTASRPSAVMKTGEAERVGSLFKLNIRRNLRIGGNPRWKKEIGDDDDDSIDTFVVAPEPPVENQVNNQLDDDDSVAPPETFVVPPKDDDGRWSGVTKLISNHKRHMGPPPEVIATPVANPGVPTPPLPVQDTATPEKIPEQSQPELITIPDSNSEQPLALVAPVPLASTDQSPPAPAVVLQVSSEQLPQVAVAAH